MYYHRLCPPWFIQERPRHHNPIENVVDFFAGHLASDHQLITAKLWPDIASKLQGAGRWGKVFGPLSSEMATLLDVGWRVPELAQWVSPDGALWHLDLKATNFLQMLKEFCNIFSGYSLEESWYIASG